jgi:NADPH2:quinone reductase
VTLLAYQVSTDGENWCTRWEHVPDPVAGQGMVIVAVKAAALAWSDVLQATGRYAGAVPDPPFTSGHEFAGVVIESGQVAEFKPGDRVFGFLPSPGAFCEYLAVPTRYLHCTPDGLDDITAAALTTSFLTADVALVTVGGLTPQSTIVVHAGAGGVGRSAIQLARAYGATQIIATAGNPVRRADAVDVGADICVGYDDFAELVAQRTDGRGADIILESVGGAVFDASARALAPMGRLITIGASSGQAPGSLKLPLLWQRSISVCGLHIARLLDEAPHVLEPSWSRLLPLLTGGAVDAGVGLVVASDQIDSGIRALTSRAVSGRVVIDFTRGLSPDVNQTEADKP